IVLAEDGMTVQHRQRRGGMEDTYGIQQWRDGERRARVLGSHLILYDVANQRIVQVGVHAGLLVLVDRTEHVLAPVLVAEAQGGRLAAAAALENCDAAGEGVGAENRNADRGGPQIPIATTQEESLEVTSRVASTGLDGHRILLCQ